LAGTNELTEGERVLGHNVELQYFAQHQLEALTLTNTVQKEVESAATYQTHPIVRSLLGAFLFSGDDVEKPVGVLSGGEKSRVALAKMLVRSSNLLILDEPTNHLDIDSREVLEQALRSFGGTVVFTSHDRQFIDNVATKVIEVRGGELHHYLGNYTYYAWKKAHLEEDQATARRPAPSRGKDAGQEPAKPDRADEARVREADKDRKRREAELRNALHRKVKPLKDEFDEVENAITHFEIRQETVERDLADPEVYQDAERVKQLTAERAEIQRDLARAMSRWEQLGSLIEAAEREAGIKA
jgi:ATP-binding cassette subfamily F protein 3